MAKKKRSANGLRFCTDCKQMKPEAEFLKLNKPG